MRLQMNKLEHNYVVDVSIESSLYETDGSKEFTSRNGISIDVLSGKRTVLITSGSQYQNTKQGITRLKDLA